MLLGFLAGLLNRYIGEYFENLDASQLTGSLFGGGVTLNNLNLRPTIFDSLGVPFRVISGKCGTLEVKYSLTRLYSEPIVVHLKDFHVLVVPSKNFKYDASAEKNARQQEKLRQLQVFESIKHHIIHQVANEPKASDLAKFQEITYFDMWVTIILRNILFKVESLHVRFEDDVTNAKEPFAVGLTLESLSVLTTNSDWTPQYMKEYVPETMYKLVEFSGLSVYWNPAPTTLYKQIQDKVQLLTRLSTIPKARDPGFRFLFSPLSLEIKVQITPFPDMTKEPFSKPRILIDTSKDEFMISLSDRQYKDISLFLDTIDMLVTSHKFRKFRPEVPYKGNCKEWWQFAYNCVRYDIQRRRGNYRWKTISEHRDRCKKYVELYLKKKVEKTVTPEIEATLTTLEEELDLFNLILLRTQVGLMRAHVNGAQSSRTSVDAGYYSWFSWWWSSTPSQPPPDPVARASGILRENQYTVADKEKLQLAMSFVKKIDVHNYPETYVDVEATVLFNVFRILIYRFHKRQRETVLESMLDKVALAIRTRPVGNGAQVEIKLGRIEAFGGDIPRGALDDAFAIPQILATANPGLTEYFIKIVYDKAPLDSDVDHRVNLEALALQFTYHEETIEKLMEVFTLPSKNTLKVPGPIPATIVLNRIMQFKASKTGKLLKMMENKGKVEFNACLLTPYIILPIDTKADGKHNFVVINLGEVSFFGHIVGGTICQNGACADML